MAKVGGEEYGPFTWDQMLQMAAEGRVTPDLPVRQASAAEWSTAALIPGLLSGAKPAPCRPAAKPPAKAATAAGKSAVKKARPLGPPAVSRPAPPIVAPPQNIPAGIPVGSPVGSANGAAPRSFVEPPPVAASPSGAFNFDLGASPSGKQRSAKKSVLDDDDEGVTRKKSNIPLIVGALGGVAALVAVIVGLTIYITMSGGGKDEKTASTNTSTGNETPKAEQKEANPGGAIMPEGEGETDVKQPATAKGNAKTSAAETQPILEADQKLAQAALNSVPTSRWVNVATHPGFGIGNAKVEISRVWLSNPSGEESSSSAEGSQKYLAIEFVISNKAGATLKYKGWNNPSKSPVFLTDEKDQLYKLIPMASTPGIPRLTKADIPGGGRVSEALVFEAPSESFEELKMLLPQNVFYPKTTNPYFGIAITPDVVASGGGPPVAAPPTGLAGGEAIDPLVSGRRVPLGPGTPEGPAETTTPQPKTVVKPEEPPPPEKAEPD